MVGVNKTVFIIVDGMADLPIKELGNKTPLDYAIKNNLHKFLRHSELAYPTVLGKMAPQSDAGVMADLGYDPIKYSTGRGWFECLGLGMKPETGQLSIRINFGSVYNGMLKDVRVYMQEDELEELSNEINDRVKISADFDFKAGVGYRAGLVLRNGGGRFSHFVSNNEPGYTAKFFGNKIKLSFATEINNRRIQKIKAIRNEAAYTAEVLNDFILKASKVIKSSKVYNERVKKRLPVPNYLFLRDAADSDPGLEDINRKYGRKWVTVAGMPLEKGIALSAGMSVLNVNENKNIKEDFEEKIKKITYAISKFDAVYVHIKQTDSLSHLGKFIDKYAVIEAMDKIIISGLSRVMDPNKDTLVLTCDHATSSKLKRHINSNIPVMIANDRFRSHTSFDESSCRTDGNKSIKKAVDIMPFVMKL
jgi:2,3-bisphosphoglycerate-independent phosphoglycerate mutase